MTDKPKTRAQLEADVAEERGFRQAAAADLQTARAREKQTRLEIDDLKERLAHAEDNNQFMRGYLARVREDDVVREELVQVGDPLGEQQLVPKRKPTSFDPPSGYSNLCATAGASSYDHVRDRPRPKHWVTY